jgi:hypothetical protein
MSVRFLNPHNVKHGSTAIAKCREATVAARCAEVKPLRGDGAAFATCVAAFDPRCEVDIVTEDVSAALSLSIGRKAALTLDVADAEGGADKTITCANAVYLGPTESLREAKSGPAAATLRFECQSANGVTNPISIS